MNRSLKVAGISAVALLMASAATHAATITVNANPVAFANGGSVGNTDVSIVGSTISGPAVLDARWEAANVASVTPAGYTLEAVNWALSVTGTWAFTLGNTSGGNITYRVDFYEAEFTPGACCPPIFVGSPNGLVSDFDDFNAGRQNVVVAPGQTVDLNGRSFNFSQGGSFTDPSDLLAFINSPTPRLEGFLETFLSARLPAGDDVSNNSTTQMSLSLEYVFRQDPVNVIPLPAAGWMLLSGIAGLGGLGYFRRRTNA